MSSRPEGSGSVAEHPKISPVHWQRLAYVYVRQSSLKQVRHNRESQINQYGLVERAKALGWSAERIRVIDADLGLSASTSEHRHGFQALVAEVSLDHVGIIFGYEVARLARNNRDWYYLLDLAAVFGTLIADLDGVYDPRLYNDRLLLGLKGTMSEAELHLLRQRLDAGRLSKVKRGEYRQRLPTGLVRLADGQVVKEPDDQVRHTLALVFDKFEELGSCGQVLGYLLKEQILLPRRQTSGPQLGQIVWKEATYPMVREIIRNPAYAGAFAYGRRQLSASHHQPGRPGSGRLHRAETEWIHLQQDVYPAYISWAQYQRNRQQLRQNATDFRERTQPAQGAARAGSALLQGLVVCGQCGYRMRVSYSSGARYSCEELKRRMRQPICTMLPGPPIDEVVVQAFFEAIRPAQLDALAAVLADQQADRARLSQQWDEQLKRAEYEANLARRQYDAVDPANRLVAAELERRWEAKLQERQRLQEEYARFEQRLQPQALSAAMRTQFQAMSAALPELWLSGQLSNEHKKQLLRSLIRQVILNRDQPDRASLKIVWISGHYSTFTVPLSVNASCQLSRYDELVEQIQTLWQQGLTDQQIAQRLTQAGFRSPRAPTVLASTVQRLRWENQWYDRFHLSRDATEVAGYLTARGLANRLGVSTTWVYGRLKQQAIAAPYVTRHPSSGLYLIKADETLIEQLRQSISRPRKSRHTCGVGPRNETTSIDGD